MYHLKLGAVRKVDGLTGTRRFINCCHQGEAPAALMSVTERTAVGLNRLNEIFEDATMPTNIRDYRRVGPDLGFVCSRQRQIFERRAQVGTNDMIAFDNYGSF